MRTLKHLLFTLILILLCIGALALSAFAAEEYASGTCGAEGDDLTWVLDYNGTLTISGTGAIMDCYMGEPWSSYRGQIKAVVIEDGVTEIGACAFSRSQYLTTATIPSSVTVIGDGAFSSCYRLASINILDGVATIEDGAFSDCRSLAEITLPNTVTSIGDGAFAQCVCLGTVSIPDSVTSIGDGAFACCDSLTNIQVSANNPNYCNDEKGVLFNKDQTALIAAPSAIIGSYTIPSTVTAIGNCAFAGCYSLTSVTIPDSVTSIGDEAFSGCESLISVHLPNRVTVISRRAFSGCSLLSSINIPDCVTTIGEEAFTNCTSLTNIAIEESVTSIGEWAFAGCTSLTKFQVAANNPNYCNDEAGVLFNKNKTTLLFAPGAINGSYTIPATVVTIGKTAFKDCTNLTAVTVPNSVTAVSENAFSGCRNLAEVYFSGNAPSFGFNVFFNVVATAYYPGSNSTWTDDVMQNYNGIIT